MMFSHDKLASRRQYIALFYSIMGMEAKLLHTLNLNYLPKEKGW